MGEQANKATGMRRPIVPQPLLYHPADTATPVSEFLCPGCGRPLAITLRSDMCFAEAQTYCADCEREYQERRGKWARRG